MHLFCTASTVSVAFAFASVIALSSGSLLLFRLNAHIACCCNTIDLNHTHTLTPPPPDAATLLYLGTAEACILPDEWTSAGAAPAAFTQLTSFDLTNAGIITAVNTVLSAPLECENSAETGKFMMHSCEAPEQNTIVDTADDPTAGVFQNAQGFTKGRGKLAAGAFDPSTGGELGFDEVWTIRTTGDSGGDDVALSGTTEP
jgi:hypothetical protein